MSERIIIGEMDQAGLPISAPVATDSSTCSYKISGVRWVKHDHYFALEQFDVFLRRWVEVTVHEANGGVP